MYTHVQKSNYIKSITCGHSKSWSNKAALPSYLYLCFVGLLCFEKLAIDKASIMSKLKSVLPLVHFSNFRYFINFGFRLKDLSRPMKYFPNLNKRKYE